ncbi:MAG: amino acid adenylation domain-containing protein, partial [Chloroflexota bacterium]
LFESTLIKMEAETFVWYLNLHHLIADAWATSEIYNYVAEVYQGLSEDSSLSLPAYADYLQQEQAYRHSSQYAKADAYWVDKLATPLKPTNFYGRPVENAGARSKRVKLGLGRERSQAIKQLAQTSGFRALSPDMSLFNLFSAAFLAYLHKINGEMRVGFGTPFHNRMTPAFKKTIGLFINMYPFLVELDTEETFASLVGKARNELFSTLRYANHDMSSNGYNRAFDVVMNYLTVSFSDFAGLPMQPEWHHPGFGDSNHGLRLQIHDFADSGIFQLYFDFNEDIFDEARQQWTIQHFVYLLDQLIANPEQPIHQVSLLSETEWQHIGVDFNQTKETYPADQTAAHLFERQAALTPEAVALRFDSQTLTYDQLNRRANQLAHYLITQQGVGPDQLVGLCVERSPEAIIGMLGVLKAGGAYVPLDPAYPQERLSFLLTDSHSSLLLTQQSLFDNLPAHSGTTLCLDRDWNQVQDYAESNPVVSISPDNLAYVIYTSGSTGTPKGTLICHSNLINYIWWTKQFYLQGQKLDFPLFSSLSFDLTVTSIFVPLISGGSIVIYGEGDAGNLVILDVFKDNLVDIIKLTPAHLSLLKEIDPNQSRLRKMIVGGEDFKRDLARSIQDQFGDQLEIYNEYGPTEATVGCMIHRFDPNHDVASSVPIGQPINNAQVYILDDNLQPVPLGMIGEMCVGGAGVARGYLNRSELTATRFVSNPFQPGSILYRTGDLARWTSDGQIQFLGRADAQVKVKGYRIELGEIENTLLTHPQIESTTVTLFQAEDRSAVESTQRCVVCGLPDNYPGATLDSEGVCNTCREFDAVKARFQPYFKTSTDLQRIFDFAKQKKTGQYDCLVLYSGGKDSTYMLYQLVKEGGMTPLVFSLDNGYISEEAKANMRRVTDDLGVDLVFGQTPHMNAVFVDSLKRHSNVCDGCFKVIASCSESDSLSCSAARPAPRVISTAASRSPRAMWQR